MRTALSRTHISAKAGDIATLFLFRVVFVGGEAGELPPSLDLAFPPAGLCENLGGRERGRGGKGERKGWGDHLPYFPHWLLPQIPSCYYYTNNTYRAMRSMALAQLTVGLTLTVPYPILT